MHRARLNHFIRYLGGDAIARRSMVRGLAAALPAIAGGATIVNAGCAKEGKSCGPDRRCCKGYKCKNGRCRCKAQCCGKSDCGAGNRCLDGTCVVWAGTCAADANRCLSFTATCNGTTACACVGSLSGETRCASWLDGVSESCNCQTDADCLTYYPDTPGVFCSFNSGNTTSTCPCNGWCAVPCPS